MNMKYVKKKKKRSNIQCTLGRSLHQGAVLYKYSKVSFIRAQINSKHTVI